MVLKIATTGLVVSCLVHLTTFTDYVFPGQVADKILLVLFLGLVTVWIPNARVWKRLGERHASAYVAELQVPMRRGYTLPFVSPGLRTLHFLCFAYVFFTALRDMALRSAGSGPARPQVEPLLRFPTAAFIWFYYIIVAIQYTAIKRDKGRHGVV